MSTRMLLNQAAWNGDVDHFLKELDNNPTALHAITLEGGESPLHIACFAGHVNFVEKVIELRHDFSRELNQDGFTPLHIAAACGHAEIVNKLLKVDLGLCLIKGKHGKIPLHSAVIKGKVEVVRELLLAGLDSVEWKTAQHETSLHLAVKNYQFEALQVLIQHLKQFNKEDLLNSKDIYGNTILHLAVSKKQFEENIELNALNNSGLTPLDMLLMFRSEAGDREIEEILIQAGALKSEKLKSLAYKDQRRPSHPETKHENPRPRNWYQFLRFFEYDKTKELPSEVRNTLLVIVILIMTATYQTALSPPGGVWQDDCVASNGTMWHKITLSSNINNTEPHICGNSITGTNSPQDYISLMCANSFGFFVSYYMIIVLTYNFPMQLELNLALIGVFFCYYICVSVTAPYDYMRTLFMIILFPIVFSCFHGTQLLRYIRRKLTGLYIRRKLKDLMRGWDRVERNLTSNTLDLTL